MKLSIIVLSYNEEKTFPELIKKVKNIRLPKGIEKEILVVDDCSKNNVRLILEKLGKDKSLRVIRHETNQGKGACIKTGIEKSTGEIIVPQDGDLEYDPNDIPKLLKIMIENNYEAIYGSRLKRKFRQLYIANYVGNRNLTGLINLLYGACLTDSMTCYKMFRRSAFSGINLKSRGFEFDAEITCKLLKKGVKIHEEMINYFPRTYEQGKNIKWADGFKILFTILKCRFFG